MKRPKRISRREFCLSAAWGFLFASPAGAGWSEFPPSAALAAPRTESTAGFDVAAIERARILRAANRYLGEQPITITSYPASRAAGGKHDYFSEGDYWWPDPKNPGGPYVHRDGMTNPDNFTEHRRALIRLSLQAPALAAAWQITKQENYAAHAAKHLRAWFLDPATLMNPNLQDAQAIQGITTGRGTGVIDTIHLVEVARSIAALADSKALSSGEQNALEDWFARYLDWMTTSANGKQERDAKNNHGTCWVMQAAEFARYTRNSKLTEYCRARLKTVLMPHQIAADGSFPEELRRTKPYGYCLFNLDAMATVCQILSTPDENLFRFELPDGRGVAKAMAFMFPYIRDKKTWPHPPDVMDFDQWPVRQPSLLFAGLALQRPEYLALWRTLNPDPTVEEAIRNYPIRQPVLWVKSS